MTQNNIVATIAAICSVLTALIGYLKTRRVQQGVDKVYRSTNGRFTYLFDENRRLREQITAMTGEPTAAVQVAESMETSETVEGRHARDS